MKATEAAALLTVAAAFDNRKPDADQAKAWAVALDGLRFEDCRDAVVAHYRDSREWMMPVDVRTKVNKIRSDRLSAYGTVPLPSHIDPDDTGAVSRYLLETKRAIADGEIVNPAPAIETTPLDPDAASARIAYLRSQLARRTPEPERPTELAAPAAQADAARAVPSTPRPRPEET